MTHLPAVNDNWFSTTSIPFQHHSVVHGMDVVQCNICDQSKPTCETMLKHFCYHHPDSFLQLMCRNDQQVKEFDLWKQKCLDSDEPPLSRSVASSYPFCTTTFWPVPKLSNHFIAAFQIRRQISDILQLMLKNCCVSTAKKKKKSSLSCRFCYTAFPKKDVLQEHIYHEFHYMPIQCDTCSYSTSNKVHLKGHYTSSHSGKFPPFRTCKNDNFELSGTKFASEEENSCIVIEKPYQCVQCMTQFQSTGGMRIHLYTHLKYYHYHCSICHEGFASQERVEQHQHKKCNVMGQYSTKQVRFETKDIYRLTVLLTRL